MLKSSFLAYINSNRVYFKFILFLSIAALRVCVEDRRSFTESRRVPATRRIGSTDIWPSSVARFVPFHRRFGEGAPSDAVVRLAELRLDARANVWIMMK